MLESDKRITLDWSAYSIIAEKYLNVGQVEKALTMLNKLEGMLATSKNKQGVLGVLLNLYAQAGRRKSYIDKGYISMMNLLMKFDDIEGVEQIFEEWESRGLSYDFQIPNFLIGAYCKNGLLRKAEALFNRGLSKGGVPMSSHSVIWQVSKAIEALNKAMSICLPKFIPSKETLRTCVEYWENQGNVEKAEEFVRSLEEQLKVSYERGLYTANLEPHNVMQCKKLVLNMLGMLNLAADKAGYHEFRIMYHWAKKRRY
ncbi:hypothetical protein H5410_049917 [Solanum commersonii]|uniref:Pentatricopeptide repeat-containing protein n=1 Tax=Solanum commersonii TaxID=4109 RepID=A0A9J5WU58_SOLCO|nr:hypothetical protein H5410_049917 [Solanum commersonii]